MHSPSTTIAPAHATALVKAASALQAEARSFGEDANEGYMLLHAALADALKRRAIPDPRSLSDALRVLAKSKADPVPDRKLVS